MPDGNFTLHLPLPEPAISPSPLTGADAIAAILTWGDLRDTERRDMISAVNRAAETCGARDARDLVVDCTWLNARLFRRRPASHGVTSKIFANILSGLRKVMRRLRRHVPAPYAAKGMHPAWSDLYDLIPDTVATTALPRFLRVCDRLGLLPAEVGPDTVPRFEAWMRANELHDDIPALARTAITAWNRCASTVPGWPAVTLPARSGREQYALPLDAYPSSFAADVASFARELALADPEAIFRIHEQELGGPAEPTSPRRRRAARHGTVQTRIFNIRMAAGALVKSGVPPAAITALRDLVQPIEQAKTILKFFIERHGNPRSANAGAVGEVLRQIALFHCGLPKAEVDRISAWRDRVAPTRDSGLSPKNVERLKALVESRARAHLLALPQRLMTEAAALEGIDGARKAMTAAMVEILLIWPGRFGNVTGLRLDRHLKRFGTDHGRISHILVMPDEVKNDTMIEWPVPDSSARLLETFITRYRGLLGPPGSQFLFPAQVVTEHPRHMSSLRANFCREVEDATGCAVHPHLMRHFAAWLYLKAHPGSYEVVRRLLGHKSVQMTVQFYCGLEAGFAAESYDAIMLEERRRLRPLAHAPRRGARLRRTS